MSIISLQTSDSDLGIQSQMRSMYSRAVSCRGQRTERINRDAVYFFFTGGSHARPQSTKLSEKSCWGEDRRGHGSSRPGDKERTSTGVTLNKVPLSLMLRQGNCEQKRIGTSGPKVHKSQFTHLGLNTSFPGLQPVSTQALAKKFCCMCQGWGREWDKKAMRIRCPPPTPPNECDPKQSPL